MTRASLREYAVVQRERYQQATRPRSASSWTRSWPSRASIAKPPSGCCGGRPGRGRGPGPAAARGRTAPRSPRPPSVLAGQRPDRRPSPAPLRPRAPRSACSVRRSPCRPRSTSSCGRPVGRPSPGCWRRPGPSTPGGATTTRPGTWLKQEIPIRTFTEWDDARPGFCEVDLVAALWPQDPGLLPLYALRGRHRHRLGRAPRGLGQAARARRQCHSPHLAAVPVPLVGLDSDNGSEFINRHLTGNTGGLSRSRGDLVPVPSGDGRGRRRRGP